MTRLRFSAGLPVLIALLLAGVNGVLGAQSDPATNAGGKPEVESGFVEIEGGKVYYEAAGEGPSLVMLHDGLMHRVTWDGQMEIASRHFRAIRWDRLGYGKSDTPTGPISDVEGLAGLIDGLELERVTLLATSAGALVALYYALDHPGKVSALVLSGPLITGLAYSDHAARRGDRGMPARMAPAEEKIVYWPTKDPWMMAPESLEARKRLKEVLIADPQNLSAPPFRTWPGYVVLPRLSEISVPTLIVVGESDIADVHAHAGVLQAMIPDSKRVVLNGGGHLVHAEAVEEFNKVVFNFLLASK